MADRLRFLLIIGLLCIATAVGAQGQPTPAASDVTYRGDAAQRLDVFLPDSGTAPYPVVLMFHGQPSVSRTTFLNDGIPQAVTAEGYAAIPVDYAATLPQAYEDAFCALAWVVANAAQYNLDTSRVALFGTSWGGLTSAFVAATTDPAPYLTDCPNTLPADFRLRGVVTNSGAFLASVDEISFLMDAGLLPDLAALPPERLQKTLDSLRGTTPDQWCCLFFEPDIHDLLYRFPVFHVNEGTAPHLMIQGLKDVVVPYQDTLNYAAALLGKGVSVEMVFVPGAGHIVPLASFEDHLTAFLRRVFS